MHKSATVAVLSLLVAAFAMGARFSPERGPVVIDLKGPGDALAITPNGKHVGGFRVDAHGRLGIYGPNHSSTAVTLDGRDKLQIDPQPVDSPPRPDSGHHLRVSRQGTQS